MENNKTGAKVESHSDSETTAICKSVDPLPPAFQKHGTGPEEDVQAVDPRPLRVWWFGLIDYGGSSVPARKERRMDPAVFLNALTLF